mmetsp:Transcript_24311/g.27990  ORF Transcript_24311/g.27990 Transcript_24311/m.27990 type:complete len:84 (-) Transcript_24311:32-283(-)
MTEQQRELIKFSQDQCLGDCQNLLEQPILDPDESHVPLQLNIPSKTARSETVQQFEARVTELSQQLDGGLLDPNTLKLLKVHT